MSRRTGPVTSRVNSDTGTRQPTPKLAERTYDRGSLIGTLLIREAVAAAGLNEPAVDIVAQAMPARFTESDAMAAIAAVVEITRSKR